eukprot:1194148-Amphidinium_carterae.1
MCPYLEWAGWHSAQRPKPSGFMEPAVVPSLMRKPTLPRASCPKVYVYRDLPRNWTVLDVHQLTPKDVFGSLALQSQVKARTKYPTHPALRPVSQHDGIKALYA